MSIFYANKRSRVGLWGHNNRRWGWSYCLLKYSKPQCYCHQTLNDGVTFHKSLSVLETGKAQNKPTDIPGLRGLQRWGGLTQPWLQSQVVWTGFFPDVDFPPVTTCSSEACLPKPPSCLLLLPLAVGRGALEYCRLIFFTNGWLHTSSW